MRKPSQVASVRYQMLFGSWGSCCFHSGSEALRAEPIEPGAGSATFLHIRRGETRRTSGCTTMAEPALQDLVVWLRAAAQPRYVLIPRAEYERLAPAWGLPVWEFAN